jgi:hypothetical protein
MLFEKAGAAAGVAAIGGAVAAVGGGLGWLSGPGALAVLLGGVVLGALFLAWGRRAGRTHPHDESVDRTWRRADGPWPAYDRRRSAPGEPVAPVAPEPQRDRATTE